MRSKHVLLVCDIHSVYLKTFKYPSLQYHLHIMPNHMWKTIKANLPGVFEVVTTLQLHSHFWR